GAEGGRGAGGDVWVVLGVQLIVNSILQDVVLDGQQVVAHGLEGELMQDRRVPTLPLAAVFCVDPDSSNGE
ncbi:hypothetical protein INR49_023389, partial [Caranx melampygus]